MRRTTWFRVVAVPYFIAIISKNKDKINLCIKHKINKLYYNLLLNRNMPISYFSAW